MPRVWLLPEEEERGGCLGWGCFREKRSAVVASSICCPRQILLLQRELEATKAALAEAEKGKKRPLEEAEQERTDKKATEEAEDEKEDGEEEAHQDAQPRSGALLHSCHSSPSMTDGGLAERSLRNRDSQSA